MRWGASYYPELVPESEWERDLDLMRGAGLDTLRILDFAWTALEPREGCYQFEWLDRFLKAVQARNMTVVLCTPTATPPAWLARQFPEIMIEDAQGHLRPFGNRREPDVDSPIYRHFCVRLAEVLGRRYGKHPAVIGWQLDNELLGSELMRPECHSRASQWRFRDFLKRRHGQVERLNERWGQRFWNQEYSDWGEVQTPRHERPSLGHWLDYCRYFSESQREFLRVQADALRASVGTRAFIAHNSTAIFDRGLDHMVFGEALDVVGWDAYFGAASGKVGAYRAPFAALAHDLFRSTKHQPFWIFETNPLNAPACSAYYAEMAARGAEAVLFWHWRAHRFHVEQTCEAICDFAGRPIEDRLALLQRLRERPELKDLPGSCGQRSAAILFSPDCVRHETQPNPYRREKETTHYLTHLIRMYQALWRLGVAVDVVRPGDDLQGYELVAVPSPIVLSKKEGARIVEHVANGAVFLGCASSAHKDEYGVYYRDLGEPLAELLGFTLRADERGHEERTLRFTDGRSCAGGAWAERVERTDGEVLARIEGGALDGCIGAFRRTCGSGQVFYLTTCGDDATQVVAALAAREAGFGVHEHGYADLGILPDASGTGTWYFNYGGEGVEVAGLRIPPGDFRRV